MYLISLYFDHVSSKKIKRFIDKAALKSGNKFMVEGGVPPHITIAAFQSNREEEIIEKLDEKVKAIKSDKITWASIGVFKSSVIFLAPVLNEYLHELSVQINSSIAEIKDISVNNFYRPFQWMPHTTIAKKLTREELIIAFQEVEKNFSIFSGEVTRIGLSKTNPYEEIAAWNLEEV